jgi:hypothetical protein
MVAGRQLRCWLHCSRPGGIGKCPGSRRRQRVLGGSPPGPAWQSCAPRQACGLTLSRSDEGTVIPTQSGGSSTLQPAPCVREASAVSTTGQTACRRRGCAGGCAAAAAVCECVGGTGISWPCCSARPWHARFTCTAGRRPWSSGLRLRAAVGPPAPGGSPAAPAAGETSKRELYDTQLTLNACTGLHCREFHVLIGAAGVV